MHSKSWTHGPIFRQAGLSRLVQRSQRTAIFALALPSDEELAEVASFQRADEGLGRLHFKTVHDVSRTRFGPWHARPADGRLDGINRLWSCAL